MNVEQETVTCVYDDKVLVAIIKRDSASRKSLVYVAKEANVEQIADLISDNES